MSVLLRVPETLHPERLSCEHILNNPQYFTVFC